MIKWHYFSKFLKLSLFGFLISFSTVFANSVDSSHIKVVWSSYSPSPYYNNYDVTVLKRWKFLSNYIWQAKPLYALGQYTYLFWNNWELYFYDYWNYCSNRYALVQWFFQYYKICDEIISENQWTINCWNLESYDEEVVWRFLQNIDNWDLFLYDVVHNWDSYCRSYSNDWSFCFSSHSLWKSLCFQYSLPSYWTLFWLIWSLDLPAQQGFWINVWLLSDPPSYAYIDDDPTDSSQWSLWVCPTVWQLLATYSSDYNSSLCYSSSLLMSWGSVVSVTPNTIFELYPTLAEFRADRELFWNYCSNSVSLGWTCQQAFSWKDIEYTLLAKIPWSVKTADLYQYCNLSLNHSSNESTCVSSWVYQTTWYTREDVIKDLVDWDYSIVVPSEDSIVSQTLWDWYEWNWDIITTIQSLFWKFTSLFKQQTWNTPCKLPIYIVSFLLVIILFRLFKI